MLLSKQLLSKEFDGIGTGLEKNAAGYRPAVGVVISADEP
ncbi:hypothetical protein BFJ71_g16461 [Fusarium oxysporum]|nr:hypothetical protein BFJ71_g16461 [Fusarium oxysporum]